MEVSSQMQLQRSSVSFRRQGSSGRVWEDIRVDRSGPLLNSFSGPMTPTATTQRTSQEIQHLDNIRSGREEKFQSGGSDHALSRNSSLPADQKLQRRNGGALFFIRCCSGSPPTS
ncbi:hypothetical protein LINGRAHAP2_LOCUS6816 [Linum grandiflorum]